MDLTSPNDTVPAPGGALTEMLRALRLEGVDYGRCELGTPWAVLFPVQKAARFHFIGRAGCWLLSPLGEWMELKAGDALLLPRGAEHILASAPGVQAEPLESYSVEPLQDNVYAASNGGHGAKTLLFCGSMRFNHDGSHPLLAMMPDMLRAKELMAGEPGIPHLLEAMADEATRNRAGSGMMLARLADVLAAAIIRSWVENSAGDITGWIAAIKDRDIGRVLVAIHRQPDRNWTVEALAREMGASRSAFAERFTAVVGETPAKYVAGVRMHQARRWLEEEGMRVSVIAARLGYDSEASFSRAFKRIVGSAPSHLRAAGGGSGKG
ncbi:MULTISPECIES: AraC family transcriptional regulator [unclassified Mesorhizobium]|uniref:AraC family transcriptional regulator n=1 Tax=unclassified Mesorhizobium TaxID=325217 RepID=UPI00112C1848|nr:MULTISPECIES: AraC family transcriptional regulator [unclassified Mesorhizobium]TPI50870.1 AraC family transcriptional regulator [Mesorhizobium sp. B3-1-1]TPJ65854.1 AraC family transcriptional regulator [Mesorhizobium sp. B2-6-7]TPJ80520.1 AraC family transcriptional regulator [Mesorhizobium sp. B2-6-3]TPJ96021.1 AraC family transcriptional regulator [Mesorhizobium sp. B2-5-10]TPK06443.1 AraC family transcriptional regulator [Mesorhizobium sp. B2-5-11]